jgi:hypothetical protein
MTAHHYTKMDDVLTQVRRQHRTFFARMGSEGVRWHLYRVPGTNQFSLFREDATFDVPLELVLENVHAMSEEQLALKVTHLMRGL